MTETERKIFWRLQDEQVAGLTAYGEARNQEDEGIIAVVSVILTRVDHRRWDGNSIKEVCYMPFQFSCFLENDPNYKKLFDIACDWRAYFLTDKALEHCYWLAKDVINGIIPRNVHATQYYAPKGCKEPAWVKKMDFVAAIGDHRFYIDKNIK